MSDWKRFFKNKKVTLMGLGLLGRGVGDALFLAQHGARILVTDLKTETQLADSLAVLKEYKDISYVLGGHRLEDFRNGDFVLKAAGVPLGSPYIAEARRAGVPVYMSTALCAKFAREMGATIVGVTGTRGKSTVTHLMYHTLKKAGRRVHLGGNVRGVSTLALLPKIKKGDVCVLELDSWQLQGFGDLEISPHIAVFTNLQDDHLNYYPNKEVYFADKTNIFRFQKKGDALIAGAGIVERIKKENPPVAPVVPSPLPAEARLKILGAHNRENAGLAAGALCCVGLSQSDIKKGLESFQPVEGRLQYLRTIRGVEIYNDNNATTPDATVAALRALSLSQFPPFLRGSTRAKRGGGGGVSVPHIILIAGGTDKGLDMSTLVDEIPRYCKAIILLKENGTIKIQKAKGKMQKENSKLKIAEGDGLQECVDKAMQIAKKGDIVLFSPAFASFGRWFKNEYDRGEQFVKIVKNL